MTDPAEVSVIPDGAPDPLGPDGHLLLLPGSEAERRARVAQWVRRGLDRDEKVIYAGSSEGWLFRVLGDSGVDVAAPLADGRLLVVARSVLYAPGGLVDLMERALDERYPGVRVSVEVGTGRGEPVGDTYETYERDMDKLCRTRPVTAMCQYDRATTAGHRLVEAAAAHFRGIRESLVQTAETEGGLSVSGEVDLSNAVLLDAALGVAAAAATDSLELDLADLSFLDVAGVRVLLGLADALRARRARLVLVAPQPQVARTLSLLDVDSLPQVDMVRTRRSPR